MSAIIAKHSYTSNELTTTSNYSQMQNKPNPKLCQIGLYRILATET